MDVSPFEIVFPHVVQDLCFGKHSVGVFHQIPQQFGFGGGQVNDFTTATDLVGVVVEFEIIDH